MLWQIATALFPACECAKPINNTIEKLIHSHREQMLRHPPLPEACLFLTKGKAWAVQNPKIPETEGLSRYGLSKSPWFGENLAPENAA